MAVKTFNTRVKNKIDRIGNLSALVPLKGEIVVGGYDGPTSGVLGENTQSKPYIVKVGDGSNTWSRLPNVATNPLIGSSDSIYDMGAGIGEIRFQVPSDERKYSCVEVSSNAGIDRINIAITGSSPLLAEHYLLIKNNGNSDIYLNSVTATFENNTSATVNTRQDWLTAGDICEYQIKVFKIGNSYYVSAIPQLGIFQSITTSNGENTWNVNRY